MTRVLLTAAVAGTITGAVIGYQVAAWAWTKASGEGR